MTAVRSPYTRSDWNKAFRFDADRENVFSETNARKHADLRQKLTMGYTGKENPHLEPDMDEVILSMVDLLKSKYTSSGSTLKAVDIGQLLQYLTLDIITALSLGKPFGWITDDEDKFAYIATMEANMPAMNFMSAVPALSRLIRMPAVQRLILPSMKDRIGMGKVKAVIHSIIIQRFESAKTDEKTSNDMTQSFIDHNLTLGEICDNALLQILAGSDTSGTILRSTMIYVTSNPHIYRKLTTEVRAAGVPPDQVISYSASQQLPYLNACIKETLRYYPINTGLSPKTVGPNGDTYNNLHLPAGTEIGISAWSLYRHNPIYGADCAVYRPERWLDSTPEQLVAMEKEHEMVFLYGRFKCLGERIARIELAKTVFELFRRFEWSLLNAMRPLEVEDNFGLWIQRGLMMRVEECET
jgi:cytochrome P450